MSRERSKKAEETPLLEHAT